jgi:hypothetical protein
MKRSQSDPATMLGFFILGVAQIAIVAALIAAHFWK